MKWSKKEKPQDEESPEPIQRTQGELDREVLELRAKGVPYKDVAATLRITPDEAKDSMTRNIRSAKLKIQLPAPVQTESIWIWDPLKSGGYPITVKAVGYGDDTGWLILCQSQRGMKQAVWVGLDEFIEKAVLYKKSGE